MNAETNLLQRDPVCGMTVDPSRAAATQDHAGKTYYFCCRGCQEKFRAEPAKYLAPKPPKPLMGIAPAPMAAVQISPAPTHVPPAPTQVQPPTAPTPAVQREYTCPMDPEVVQQGPGACPKCGMALEPMVPLAP